MGPEREPHDAVYPRLPVDPGNDIVHLAALKTQQPGDFFRLNPVHPQRDHFQFRIGKKRSSHWH